MGMGKTDRYQFMIVFIMV